MYTSWDLLFTFDWIYTGLIYPNKAWSLVTLYPKMMHMVPIFLSFVEVCHWSNFKALGLPCDCLSTCEARLQNMGKQTHEIRWEYWLNPTENMAWCYCFFLISFSVHNWCHLPFGIGWSLEKYYFWLWKMLMLKWYSMNCLLQFVYMFIQCIFIHWNEGESIHEIYTWRDCASVKTIVKVIRKFIWHIFLYHSGSMALGQIYN